LREPRFHAEQGVAVRLLSKALAVIGGQSVLSPIAHHPLDGTAKARTPLWMPGVDAMATRVCGRSYRVLNRAMNKLANAFIFYEEFCGATLAIAIEDA
jgi:hypothetical protein